MTEPHMQTDWNHCYVIPPALPKTALSSLLGVT